MFESLGRTIVGARKAIAVGALLFAVIAGLWGVGVFDRLASGGFDDPQSEASRAIAELDDSVGPSGADLVLSVENANLTVEDPEYASDVLGAVDTLPAGFAESVTSYWNTGSPALVSDDGHGTYVAITLQAGVEPSEYTESVYGARDLLRDKGYDAKLGGPAGFSMETSERVGSDIARAEAMSMPVLSILLIVIFGGIVAAWLPLVIGGLSIVGSFAILRVFTGFTDVSVFAINIVTILGLGLAIDYGLLIVGRYREELAAGHDAHTAAVRTVRTAGRTVAVSATIVAVALSGLLVFPQVFLRSMGMGGIAAVLVAVLSAVLVLPALLAMLGPNVDKWRVRRVRGTESADGFWARLARRVMRRPVGYLVGSLVLLGVLAAPVASITFGGIDQRVLPTSSDARQVSDTLEDTYGLPTQNPIVIAVSTTGPVDSTDGSDALAEYVEQLKEVPGVGDAQIAGAAGDVARVVATYDGESLDESTKRAVSDIRALDLPAGVDEALVGGETAQTMDRLSGIADLLPTMAAIVVGATFILLFLAFGSVLLPLKAIVLNLVTMTATLGVVTWIFQNGNLAGLLGFTPTGFVEATQPILVMAIVFGLSMDYEVFMLSRIREQYDATGDNTEATATGLQRTGRIITSAALLIIVVIAAFSTSSIAFIKLIGVAMLVAIVLDAVLVRMLIVPSVMRLMGKANWWLPGPLDRLYRRFGIREEIDERAQTEMSVSLVSRIASVQASEMSPTSEM